MTNSPDEGQNIVTDRSDSLAMLRSHEEELRAAGVVSLSLFGSVARGEIDTRDVDVAVRLGRTFCEPGLNYIKRLEELEQRLAEILNSEVDVVEEPVRRQQFQQEIERDRAVAF